MKLDLALVISDASEAIDFSHEARRRSRPDITLVVTPERCHGEPTQHESTDMAKQPIAHPILVTPRLRLRQLRLDDVDAMHACFADPEAMRFWNRPVHTKLIETERAVRSWIDCTPSYYRFWAVADLASDRCLGCVDYHDGHIRSRRAAIGYIIDPKHQRQGLATEAVSAMLDFCFGELGLHRIQALIQPGNAASRAIAEKLGFRHEGLLRDNLRVGEVWHDEMLYALLATERPGQA